MIDASHTAHWRGEFPVLARQTYLNTGSYGAMARSVRAALDEYAERRMTVGEDWAGWMSRFEVLRGQLASLFGASTAEIAVTSSVSSSINALASALDFGGRRRKIVLSSLEFPTDGQIWQSQRRRGAEVVYAEEAADGTIPLSSFESLIDDETLLVAITHVCYRNGVRLDIPAIAALARERGAMVMLDCYQTAGSMDLRLDELGVDFAVGGTLKYLLGSSGVGFLYVRERLLEGLVPVHTGWLAQADVSAMDIRRNEPAPTARRFEAGAPAVASCLASEAGLRLVQTVGIQEIEARVRELVTHATLRLEAAGIRVATPRDWSGRGALVAIPARDDAALVQRLRSRNIVTSCRAGNLRASFHFYNNEQDVDELLAALEANRELLA